MLKIHLMNGLPRRFVFLNPVKQQETSSGLIHDHFL